MKKDRPLQVDEPVVVVYSCGCWIDAEEDHIPEYGCPVCDDGYYESVIR